MATKYHYTKQELIDYVKSTNFTIYANEYDIINSLINELDDRLFVKIFEEIVLGNISWLDFKPVFNDEHFSNIFSDSLEFQANFNERYNMFVKFINELVELNKIVGMISYSTLATLNSSIVDIEKRNKLYSLFLAQNSDPFGEIYKNILIEKLLASSDDDSSFTVDNMLLSADEYIVPIDFKYVEINESDIEYANINGITIDELKKAKSLALYLNDKLFKEDEGTSI